ncbi:MAG TPA: HAMP domain-containing sensor histidine kinase [Phycisphaerae bacterium]|nr:HAMP domain-containing sensor histidine kinase [Phycisphaerae bacterium]HRR84883.1 HAMP domain-containing sensor histidine kinase [Phycisphaerae bacterium]
MRPWLTWPAFVVCIAVILAAMGWHSQTVLQLDRADAAAIRRAAIEERIRLALWRMDSALTPLVAQESTWPYYAYASFAPTERAYTNLLNPVQPGEILMASPLLDPPSRHVLVHFQINPDNSISSPQVPTGPMRQIAEGQYTTADKIELYTRRLAALQPILSRANLLSMLEPAEPPPVRIAVLPTASQPSADQESLAQQSEVQSFWGLSNQLPDRDLRRRLGRLDEQIYTQQAVTPQPAAQEQGQVSGLSQGGNPRQDRAQRPSSSGKQVRSSGKTSWISPDQQDLMNTYDAQARGYNYDVNGELILTNAGNSRVMRGGVKEGSARSLWIGDTLVLARRARVNGSEYIQGCRFDWPGIQSWLLGEIRDLLPEARLEPADLELDQTDTRRLAALPIRLVPGDIPSPPAQGMSPVRMTLLVAWSCLLLAAAAVIILLVGTMSLSERRAAFVSAVTHEMRTPLTTFRMYTEMLTGGMVPSEEKRRRYLDTLRVEAERLSHLVENVLAYARLEKNRAISAAQNVTLAELIARVEKRLAERAAQAGMKLEVSRPEDICSSTVHVDPSAVEQILFNLVDNACKYAVSTGDRRIRLETLRDGGKATVRVRDYGPGIPEREARKLFRPFCKSAKDAANSSPGVGLGLALSRRLARHMGGDLRLDQSVNDGACFVLTLPATVN